MASIKTLVILISVIYHVTSQGQQCLDCDNVDRPEDCVHHRDCPEDELCATEVREEGPDHVKWKFHCKKRHDCHDHIMLMGRRAGPGHDHHHHPDDHKILCDYCCDGHHTHLCNKDLCDQFGPRTSVTTTVSTSAQTATTTHSSLPHQQVYSPNCTNHEEDGITCNVLGATGICNEVDVNSISYMIAHQKCALYCGFCTPITTSSQNTGTTMTLFTATSSCRDSPDKGIDCAVLAKDQDMCTSTDIVMEYIRTKNCKKTCNLC